MGKQQSKRKRKEYQRFRTIHLSTRCQICGKKIKKSHKHHFLCNSCWKESHNLNQNKEQKMRKLLIKIYKDEEGFYLVEDYTISGEKIKALNSLFEDHRYKHIEVINDLVKGILNAEAKG